MTRFKTEADVVQYIYSSYVNRSEKNQALHLDRDRRAVRLARFLFDLVHADRNASKRVLVTGSKGKGSLCHYLSGILSQHHRKVGLFVGPHIVEFRERILVNGVMISEEDFVRIANQLAPLWDQVEAIKTVDEYIGPVGLIASIALVYFESCGVDYEIFECGKGVSSDDVGQLDAAYAMVNHIFEEHMEELGGSLEAIACNKAFIIKPQMHRIVSSDQSGVVMKILEEAAHKANVVCSFGIPLNPSIIEVTSKLPGYQQENAALACVMAQAMLGTLQYEFMDLSRITLEGRLEWKRCQNTNYLFDATIHRSGFKYVKAAIEQVNPAQSLAIISIPTTKDALEVYREAVRVFDKVVLCHTTNLNLTYDDAVYGTEVIIYPSVASVYEHEIKNKEYEVIAMLGTFSFLRDVKTFFGSCVLEY